MPGLSREQVDDSAARILERTREFLNGRAIYARLNGNDEVEFITVPTLTVSELEGKKPATCTATMAAIGAAVPVSVEARPALPPLSQGYDRWPTRLRRYVRAFLGSFLRPTGFQ